jgi:hypothetical protein
VNVGVRVAIVGVCLSGVAAACSSHHKRVRHTLPIVCAIAQAKATDQHLFVIFPGTPGTRACRIPEGGLVFGSLRGRCTTSVRLGPGYSGLTVVRFKEAWPGHFHTWAITEGPSGKPLAIRNIGDVAPQNYY